MAELIITGIISGDLTGGLPKAVELTVLGTEGETLDLSAYTLALASNGNSVPSTTFALSGSAIVGDKIYVSREPGGFRTFFGFNADYISPVVNVNGDDVVRLYQGDVPTGTVVDVYGEIGVDGTATDWEYSQSWAYRSTIQSPTTPGSFTLSDWVIPGVETLRDEINNATASTPFPMPAIYITESVGNTAIGEDGTTDTYTVVLSQAPLNPVVITITPDAQTDLGNGAGQPILLTFTPANYNQPQTVTVTAFDDGNPDNNGERIITHTATSNDPRFDSISNPNNLIINISNPDPNAIGTASVTTVVPATLPLSPPEITITQSDGNTTVSAGGIITDTYDITLSRTPTETVTVTVTPQTGIDLGNGAGVALDVVFDPTAPDFSLTQTVTVAAAEGATGSSLISHGITTADVDYSSLTIADVTATIFTPGVKIVPLSSEALPEGNQTTYQVVLLSQPTDVVTITVSPFPAANPSNGNLDVGNGAGQQLTLTFDPTDPGFSLVQTVTVTAVADGVANEGNHTGTINHFVSSTNDPAYDVGLLTPITINIIDPGISIVETDGTTLLSESGRIDQYDVVLSTVPTALVAVTVTPDAQTDLGAGVGVPIVLTFDPTLPEFDPVTDLRQTVTITAVNDGIAEGEHTSTIIHTVSSIDLTYNTGNGIVIDAVTATISGAGVSIVPLSSVPIVEGVNTTTYQYQVVLASTPVGIVTVRVTPADSQTDVGNGPGVERILTFDPNNGFTFSQTVTVTAVADGSGEGLHTGVVNHTVESVEDVAYNGITVDSVTVNIVEPGISIIETNGGTSVSELGISDQYTVTLNTVPTGIVTVTVDPDTQTDLGAGAGVPITLTFDPTAVDFDPATDLSQTVTVTAVNDSIVEGTHDSVITHAVSASGATEYPVTALPTVTATVIDCFLAGTRLLTDEGEKLVEMLTIGDRLQTFDGTLERIKWIGIQTCYTHVDHYHPLRTYPIRIKAGALGENRPIRDLYVSPDHALLVEGLLINAGALENGDSIVQTQPVDEAFVYYHIELERHSLVIAEGTPAESYLPQKQDRNTFDNGDDYAALYPHSNMQALMPMGYPRVSSKRQLPRFIAKQLRKIATDCVAAV